MNSLKKNELISSINMADEKLVRILSAVVNEYNTSIADKSENKQLFRLVYTSARTSKCTDEDIEEILENSRRNNAKLNVTGILVHTSDRFLQVLEGEKDVIMPLYNKIEKDDRHGGSNMRFCKPVDKRHFADWEMAGKKIDKSIEFNTNINEEKRKLYHSMMDGDLSSYKDEGMRVLKTFIMIS